jgi:hypothetical protein
LDVDGAPRWKGTTPAAEEAAAPPLPAGWTVTCVAVMVVPLVVPRTRTLSPVVMALAEAGLVPFWYVVEGASLTVTFWPADVVMVNFGVATVATVPDDPPAAGPDRALDPPLPDPPLPDPGPPAVPLLAAGGLLAAGLLLAAAGVLLEVALTIP